MLLFANPTSSAPNENVAERESIDLENVRAAPGFNSRQFHAGPPVYSIPSSSPGGQLGVVRRHIEIVMAEDLTDHIEYSGSYSTVLAQPPPQRVFGTLLEDSVGGFPPPP